MITDQEIKNQLGELNQYFGSERLAGLLDITVRTIQKYFSDKETMQPTRKTAGKIREVFEKYKNGEYTRISSTTEETPLPPVERGYLERSIENLTENQLRNTAVIERLVGILERRLYSEPLHGTPGGLSAPGISDAGEGFGEVKPLDKKGKSGKQ